MKPAFALSPPTLPSRAPAKPASRGVRRAFLAATVVADAAAVNLCVWLAFLVRFEGRLPAPNWAAEGHLWLPITAALVASYHVVGLYHRRRELERGEIASMVVRGNVLWLLASIAIAYARREVAGAYPTAVFFLSAAFHAGLSFGIHLVWEELRRTWIDPVQRVRRAVVIGATPEGRKLLEAASAEADHGYAFAGVLDDRHERHSDVRGAPVLGRTSELGRVVQERDVDEVVLADPSFEKSELLYHVVQCAGLDVRFRMVPSLPELVRARGRARLVAGVPLVDVFADEVPAMRDVAKRLFDIAASAAGLAVTLPFWPLIALTVKASSPGPAFYRQERVGLHGRTFHMLKFRTMRADAEARTGPVLATIDDHRVTPVGRFLRASRLDELPQLVNVLLGEMSFVGPRPERPHFVRQFLRSVPEYARRYSVRPGVTGLAQVVGAYETTARNKTRYDRLYLDNRSFLLDVKIVARTVQVVLSRRGR